MPKAIKDLELRILEVSRMLFDKEGYDQVTVRRIAQELAVAPGTLYNYFAGKEDIYFRIISETWLSTKNHILEIMERNISEKERDEQLVRWVYEESRRRRRSLLAAFSSEWRIRKFSERRVKSIQESPEDIYALLFPGHREARRNGLFFLYGLRGCLSRCPGDDEKNISYLVSVYRKLKQER